MMGEVQARHLLPRPQEQDGSRRRVQEVVLGVEASAGATQGVLGDARASGDRERRGVAMAGACQKRIKSCKLQRS